MIPVSSIMHIFNAAILHLVASIVSDGCDLFVLTEKDGKLYGRGCTDDKGPVLGWLHAVSAYNATKTEIPINLKAWKPKMKDHYHHSYQKNPFQKYGDGYGRYNNAAKFDFPQDIEEWVKSSEPAYLKPLDMSKEDMDRIKSMLKQSNVITSKTKESDNESVVSVSDEDSPINEITIIETDFGEIVARKIDEINVQENVAMNFVKKEED